MNTLRSQISDWGAGGVFKSWRGGELEITAKRIKRMSQNKWEEGKVSYIFVYFHPDCLN